MISWQTTNLTMYCIRETAGCLQPSVYDKADKSRIDNMQILFSPGCKQPLRDNNCHVSEQ